MTELGSPDPEFNRVFAQRKLERISRDQEFSGEQVGSWSRWLSASLLAINGGGALTTLSAAEKAQIDWNAGVAFALGIICALLSGVVLQECYNRRIVPTVRLDDYWIEASVTGTRDENLEELLKNAVDKSQRFAAAAPILGWTSGLLFIVGAYFLAVR